MTNLLADSAVGKTPCREMRLLDARDPQAAAAVIAPALRGFDDYTKDVGVFRAARRALLEAVSGKGQ
ncbi:MAG: hypothetical protein ACYC7E_04935 [Armatimonadota bacterium]